MAGRRGRPRKPPAPVKFSGDRAVIYLRVSAEDAKNNKHGIESQRDYCLEYVDRNQYKLLNEFIDDGLSGTITPGTGLKERNGLAAALAMAEAHECDVIVCYAQDRISRSIGLFDAIRERLIDAGVRLESFKENMDFTQNRFIANIYAAVADDERDRIAKRLYGGRRVRAKRDGLGSGGIPWGYLVNEDGALSINDEAVAAIRLLLSLRKRGKTLQQTADRLNAENYPTPKGGKWTTSNVQSVERNAALYQTGIRKWNGVEAAQSWPVIAPDRRGK